MASVANPRTTPIGFLLSGFDGFVGWLVLVWTILLGLGLRHFYVRRVALPGRRVA
jgi:hypothetical protein